MRTTIPELGDRRGDMLSDRDPEEILADARMVLADLSSLLKNHIAVLRQAMEAEQDQENRNKIDNRLRELARSLSQVLDMEMKATARAGLAPVLDLEAARDEIESRLDRIAGARSA